MVSELLAVGAHCPFPVSEGLRVHQLVPALLVIGIPNPTPAEILAVRTGKIVHRFGANQATAWMTMHFYLTEDPICQFQGELFHSAAYERDQFTDAKLAEYRDELPAGFGIGCTLVLVNTLDRRIVALRLYAWSRDLSLASLDAAEQTRNASIADAEAAASALLKYSTDALATKASLTFELPMPLR